MLKIRKVVAGDHLVRTVEQSGWTPTPAPQDGFIVYPERGKPVYLPNSTINKMSDAMVSDKEIPFPDCLDVDEWEETTEDDDGNS